MIPTVKPGKRAIHLIQIGNGGKYRVEKTVNFLDLAVGGTIEKSEVEKYLGLAITVYVMRNK